ncbi:hypothetical protein H4Q26_015720 [Puccinia striiformis f. sp. tritici PST-130]|nr:hypothetical protein H4Q26_015720 [Puccinia striiformis f. sp. tritici PST-130]
MGGIGLRLSQLGPRSSRIQAFRPIQHLPPSYFLAQQLRLASSKTPFDPKVPRSNTGPKPTASSSSTGQAKAKNKKGSNLESQQSSQSKIKIIPNNPQNQLLKIYLPLIAAIQNLLDRVEMRNSHQNNQNYQQRRPPRPLQRRCYR